ncbi:MAG TPA: hypothetical protein VEK39_09710 [Solirubrobacterales bacterium]|nr:hypothetical protein [Solirubrobacterales bacterium]
MTMHPAENRGYRELYLTGRQLVQRWTRLADALGDPAAEPVRKAADSVGEMLDELEPLTARHGLHGRVAAQGSGARIGSARAAVFDRFLERNQAIRLALSDLEHITSLLAYLATVSETRGDDELPEFCGSWERRLRRQLGAVRKAAVAMGEDPDGAIAPLDASPVGRAAHGAAYAAGTVGEWVDRQVARRRSS